MINKRIASPYSFACQKTSHLRYWSILKTLFEFVNCKHIYVICVCDTQISGPKTNFVFVIHKHIINSWVDFWWQERGGWLTAHQPTKNQAMLPSLSTHPLAPSVQEKSLRGAGAVFLTRCEQKVEAPAQGEAMARQEGEVVQQEVMLQPPARANKRVAQQEGTQQPDGVSKGGCLSRGCGVTRSNAKTNWANGRQYHIKRC